MRDINIARVGIVRYVYIVLIGMILFGLISCEAPTSSERYDKDFYYIIAGSLQDNQPLTPEYSIYVGKTIKPGQDILGSYIEDAEVVIIDDMGNTYPLEFGFDMVNEKLGYYNENLIPQSQHTYRIELHLPSEEDSAVIDTVWAETMIPKSISIDLYDRFTTDPDSVDSYHLEWETAGEDYPMIIHTADEEPVYLYSKYYCLEEWNTVRMVKPIMGSDTFDEEVDYDDPSNHYPRLLTIFAEYLPESDGNGGYQVFNAAYQGTIAFYGGYKITINSIDENFYTYLYKPESNFEYGGVHGGYGYFGSCSGTVFYTTVVENID